MHSSAENMYKVLGSLIHIISSTQRFKVNKTTLQTRRVIFSEVLDTLEFRKHIFNKSSYNCKEIFLNNLKGNLSNILINEQTQIS